MKANTPLAFLLLLLASMFIGVHPWFPTAPAAAQDNALDVDTPEAAAMSPDIPDVPREFRAAWIATVANIDWPTKPGLTTKEQQDEMLALLDLCVDMNLNAVVFQVRPHADAMYESKIEPWSYYLTGEQGQAPDPAYDPLAFTVEEAHARGLEVHVWFNPYRAHHPAQKDRAVADNHVSKAMPEAVKKLGESEGIWWMDPADPRIQKQSLDVIADVLDRYDVDAIHFDDYFYPYPSYNDGNDFPDDPTYDAYVAAGGVLPRADFRRKAVNDFVESLHHLIRSKSPTVKFGISPFGIPRPGNPHYIKGFDQYEQLYADAHLWMREGWIDYMAPQLYWEIRNPDQSYVGLLQWWHANNPRGIHVWPGLYTSRLLQETAEARRYDDDEIPQQIVWSRVLAQSPGAVSAGHIHFSIKALQENARGVADTLKAKHYTDEALIPASPWLSDGASPAPKIAAERADDGVTVAKLDPSPGLNWVVQVGVIDGDNSAWTHEIVPAAEQSATVALPKLAGPAEDDTDSAGAEPTVTVAVFTIDRAGVASPKSVQTLTDRAAR
ncbi:MAG: family 10 glycosylhydrolase [Planctomycetota bacterium]